MRDWIAGGVVGEWRPVGTRDAIEFGRLGPRRPVPTGPMSFRAVDGTGATDGPPRRVVWEWAGLSQTEGRLIPADGWRAMDLERVELRASNAGDWVKAIGPPREAAVEVPYRVWRVPYWMPTIALAVLPLLWGIRFWTRVRHLAPGHCPKCGYDLRASPGRCPECGAAARDSPPLPRG